MLGKPAVEPLEPAFQILDKQLKAEDEKGKDWSLIFLGDNIYPRGLPDIDYATRRLSEKYLKTQLDLVKGKKGKGFMIPGNHDWERMGKRGWRYVLNEEKFVTDYLDNPNVFFPKNGCPGPVEVELADDLVLIIIDTQWWLHRWAKPGNEDGCDISSKDDFIQQLDFAVQRHKNKKVIVAGHHPMFSNGTHGGHSQANQPFVSDYRCKRTALHSIAYFGFCLCVVPNHDWRPARHSISYLPTVEA